MIHPASTVRNENRYRLILQESKSPDCRLKRRNASLGLHQGAPRPSPLPDLPVTSHAGAGGARSRAISDRISANSRRGTATSASWNVTYRP